MKNLSGGILGLHWKPQENAQEWANVKTQEAPSKRKRNQKPEKKLFVTY